MPAKELASSRSGLAALGEATDAESGFAGALWDVQLVRSVFTAFPTSTSKIQIPTRTS